MTVWHEISEGPGGLEIHFHPSPDRYWPPGVIRDQPVSTAGLAGRKVRLTGQASVWMYAHVAATLQQAGCQVEVASAHPEGTARELTGSTCALQRRELGQALLVVQLRKPPALAHQAIDHLLEGPLAELGQAPPRQLCITGAASTDVYVCIAGVAAAGGTRWISCWTPRNGVVVVLDRDGDQLGQEIDFPAWLAALAPRPAHPVVLGVVGDPNVGKSVFSAALDSYRGAVGCPGWLLDCDGQAPTPPWYLSLRSRSPERAKSLREAGKRSWTLEMQARIADQLRRCRQVFDLVIADLPGGQQKVHPYQRLPPGRECMFREVDALVVLDATEGSSEAAWRAALAEHQLEDRIAAVLRSRRPGAEPALSVREEGGLWRGEVQGLNRDLLPEMTGLLAGLRPGLDLLWPALLGHARRRTEA